MNSSFLFGITDLDYILTFAVYLACLITGVRGLGRAAGWLGIFGLMAQTLAFIVRWMEIRTGYGQIIVLSFPVGSLYESLMFFALCTAAVCVYMERRYGAYSACALLSAAVVASVTFADAAGAVRAIQPTPADIQNIWTQLRAVFSLSSFAMFISGGVFSLTFLLSNDVKRSGRYNFFRSFVFAVFAACVAVLTVNFFYAMSHAGSLGYRPLMKVISSFSGGGIAVSVILFIVFWAVLWFASAGVTKIFVRLGVENSLMVTSSYGLFSIGFVLLTAGMVCGAFMSCSVSGRYWSWTPQEIWTLFAWSCFALVLSLYRSSVNAPLRSAAFSLVSLLAAFVSYLLMSSVA